MAKKMRFALEMEDGVKVRDLEELKENFCLKSVLAYLENGQLEKWLRDRYLNDEAEAVSGLDKNDAELGRKVCDIFEVDFPEDDDDEERKQKMECLKKYTDEEIYFDVIDQIAFDQDDMYNLLDEGETVIYLCGDRFPIPLGKKGIRYIGVNNPTVVISSKEKVNFGEKDINFENVHFDEKYQKVAGSAEPEKAKRFSQRGTSGSKYGSYSSGSYLNFMLSSDDKAAAKRCYEKVSVLMEGIKYDIDEDIRDIREKLRNSEIVGMADEFLKDL